MSFARLATVELHLILHYCEQDSWLRLARCSRFTLQAASDAFARQHLLLHFRFRHPWTLPEQRGAWAAVKRQLHLSPPLRSLAELLQRSHLLSACPLSVH